jgi:integrase
MARYGKRDHGKGQVRFDASRGVWRGQVTIDGKRRSVSARTEGDARKKLDRLLTGEDTPAAEGDGAVKVGEWLTLWVEELADTDTENNRKNRQWAIAKLSALHGKRMDDLRTPEVEKVLKGYAAKGMRKSSIVRMRSVLGMAYNTYNGRNGRTFNPAHGATFGKTKPSKPKRALTPKQAGALLKVADCEPRYGILVHLGLWLGLRPGEVAGLTWENVDLATGELSVVQMRRREETTGALTMANPKADSFRCLIAPPPLLDALRRHKGAQAAAGLWAHNGLVVCTSAGGPLDPSNVRREVKRMAAAAGIKFALTPNELRHTAATLLVNSGTPRVTVADMLGHVDTRMVDKHYRHKELRPVDTSAAMVAAVAAS